MDSVSHGWVHVNAEEANGFESVALAKAGPTKSSGTVVMPMKERSFLQEAVSMGHDKLLRQSAMDLPRSDVRVEGVRADRPSELLRLVKMEPLLALFMSTQVPWAIVCERLLKMLGAQVVGQSSEDGPYSVRFVGAQCVANKSLRAYTTDGETTHTVSVTLFVDWKSALSVFEILDVRDSN